MSPVAVRLAVILVVVIVAVLAARLLGRWQPPVHPRVDVSAFGHRSGIILFTSTDCATCAEALAVVETTDLPIRQVSFELEARSFERVGVEAVPLTVITDDRGRAVEMIAGVPGRRALRRAVARTGRTA